LKKKAATLVSKSLESWIWDAACSIRGAKDAPKYKDFILQLVFTKRLCDVFDDEIDRTAATLLGWKEEEKLSRIVDLEELKKNDYNISPSRYTHTSDADLSAVASCRSKPWRRLMAKEETYRSIAEIVDELDVIEAEAKETDKALRKILKQLGVSPQISQMNADFSPDPTVKESLTTQTTSRGGLFA
jgi:type I restriction-modification system DNA methylase subunit